ncbi:A-kinase anchor protein SPHKAP isoform X2 [Ascaphus truei]|uniref:A-kinase anchor protein SPHKAP isoform X2 n=1 Tax=Ascaphus truei TaxID=8439 RepID=UPI003F5A6480
MWAESSKSFAPPVMYEASENYGSSGVSSGMDPSTGNLGSSISACKKVLCSDRPAESLEYWLQNPRTLCRIGLVDERSETQRTSICFVNLSVADEERSHEALQKLVRVSPDLPKLMTSVRAQELKENEIVILSSLTSERLHPTTEIPQVPWPADVCLVQCMSGRGESRAYSHILELNKFLLGLELAQERHLQLDTIPLRAEDDTNCSVSSIEEDFLTASEQLEEDSEGENCHIDLVSEPPDDIKKIRRKGAERLQNKKSRGKYTTKEDHLQRRHTATDNYTFSAEVIETDPSAGLESRRFEKHLQRAEWGADTHVGKPSPPEDSADGNADLKNGKCLADLCKSGIKDKKRDANVCKTDCCRDSLEDPASTGQYATNLAECVLQDAFIRLSQSETPFTKEAAVSISAGNSLLSGDTSTERGVPAASRAWNELPKIVIVQSPDSYDNPTEWADVSHWPEQDCPVEVTEHWAEEDQSLGHTQSTLEVALACAATLIGTISSPHTAERIKMEQERRTDLGEKTTGGQQVAEVAAFPDGERGMEYSVPSALCGMTQVASAVAVCGLGEQMGVPYPATSSGLLAAADASTCVTLHCRIALGSSLEKLNDSIAKILLKEASTVLTSPCAYRNVGEFIDSMNERIVTSISSSKLAHVEDVVTDDLAHHLSDAILRHSMEEANRRRRVQGDGNHSFPDTEDTFLTTVTDLLFNVMYFTCKKMSSLAQAGDMPPDFQDDQSKSADSESQLDDLLDYPGNPRSLGQWNGSQLTQCYSNSAELKPEANANKLPQYEVAEDNAGQTESCFKNRGHIPRHTKSPNSKQYVKRESYRRQHKKHRTFLSRENLLTADKCSQDQGSVERGKHSGSQEKLTYEAQLSKDYSANLSSLSSYMLHPSQPVITVKHSANNNYCVTDFADDLAETVVSMATEMAAICLENSHGKQPWFCAWKKGNECLVMPCRTIKRKKETPSSGAVVRRHRPPRLSEIKKKTDEHPELKERLMNRVVDESINLEDALDPVNMFANELASKIMNLTESSVVDALWPGQNLSRNRLNCDRWSRGKASSYESIPEEDLNAKSLVNTLGPGSMLGQSFSRTSSVSKQSSCESITDEFSRFMINQMENEGREYDLLLDYYAGRNANNILSSAMQQVSRRNDHLNVRTSCLSKQSSTESITEEFYKYMLKEIDKENKDVISSRNTREWTNSLMPPSHRTPFCFRQSSMPNRFSTSRLTVNAPVKANSLDGFARSSTHDFLRLQPVNSISSSNLCKSDSCLYQRCQTDQAMDMLIHETWSSSIEALMRKNKIIADGTEDADTEPSPKGSPAHVESYANRLAADIVQSGKSLIIVHQDSFDDTNNEGLCTVSTAQSPCKDTDRQGLKREALLANKSMPVHQPSLSGGPREVPLIQVETEQREESGREDNGNILEITYSGEAESSKQNNEKNISTARVRTLRGLQDSEVLTEAKPKCALPAPLSSSEDSTGSWSHLANDDENPEDTSSFLQLSERSVSNRDSSATSSVGVGELEVYQEIILAPTADIIAGEKQLTKKTQDNQDECTSGLSVGTASCQKEVTVINVDVDADCTDVELRTTLQWIAASELGIPTVYFRKSQGHGVEKFLEVTRLVQAKSWKVGDIFSALTLHCKIREERRELAPSFFDWLLELG